MSSGGDADASVQLLRSLAGGVAYTTLTVEQIVNGDAEDGHAPTAVHDDARTQHGDVGQLGVAPFQPPATPRPEAVEPSSCALHATWLQLLGDEAAVPVAVEVTEEGNPKCLLACMVEVAEAQGVAGRGRLGKARQNSPSKDYRDQQLGEGKAPAARDNHLLLPNEYIISSNEPEFHKFITRNYTQTLGPLPEKHFAISARDGRFMAQPLGLVQRGPEGAGWGGGLYVCLEDPASGTLVAYFQSVYTAANAGKTGYSNTAILPSKEFEGPASWALPQFLAVCHELSHEALKVWMGGLDALVASCRERGAIHVTGGPPLPNGAQLRHIRVGTFVVVRDPAWGDGRAGTYYRDAAQAAAAGAAGEWRMWDQERLVAQRVHLVLEVDTSGKVFTCKFRVAADAEPVTPVPELAPGLTWEEIYTPVPPFTSSKGGKGGKGGTAASAAKPEAGGQVQSASRPHWWRPLNP